MYFVFCIIVLGNHRLTNFVNWIASLLEKFGSCCTFGRGHVIDHEFPITLLAFAFLSSFSLKLYERSLYKNLIYQLCIIDLRYLDRHRIQFNELIEDNHPSFYNQLTTLHFRWLLTLASKYFASFVHFKYILPHIPPRFKLISMYSKNYNFS